MPSPAAIDDKSSMEQDRTRIVVPRICGIWKSITHGIRLAESLNTELTAVSMGENLNPLAGFSSRIVGYREVAHCQESLHSCSAHFEQLSSATGS